MRNPGAHTTNADYDRFTRIADTMLEAAKMHPEFEEDDFLIAGVTGADGNATIANCGFEDWRALFMVLMEHANAVARVNGSTMTVFTGPPIGRDA